MTLAILWSVVIAVENCVGLIAFVPGVCHRTPAVAPQWGGAHVLIPCLSSHTKILHFGETEDRLAISSNLDPLIKGIKDFVAPLFFKCHGPVRHSLGLFLVYQDQVLILLRTYFLIS